MPDRQTLNCSMHGIVSTDSCGCELVPFILYLRVRGFNEWPDLNA